MCEKSWVHEQFPNFNFSDSDASELFHRRNGFVDVVVLSSWWNRRKFIDRRFLVRPQLLRKFYVTVLQQVAILLNIRSFVYDYFFDRQTYVLNYLKLVFKGLHGCKTGKRAKILGVNPIKPFYTGISLKRENIFFTLQRYNFGLTVFFSRLRTFSHL